MKHLFTLLLNFTLLTAFAQTPGWQWVQHGGGDGYPGSTSSNPGRDIITSTAFDQEGNLIVGGYCSWQPVFDTISFPYVSGNTDWQGSTFFVAKYDASGNVLWVNIAGGSSVDKVNGLDVDEAGNIYVFADINATGIATARVIAQNIDTTIANSNRAFIKFSPNGNLLYLKNFYVDPLFGWDVREGYFKRMKNGNFLTLIDVATVGGNANVGGFSAVNKSRNFAIMDSLGSVLKLALIDTTAQYSHTLTNFAIDDNENIYFTLVNLTQPSITILSQQFSPAKQLTGHLIKTDTSFTIKDIAYGYKNGCIGHLTTSGNRLFAGGRNVNGAIFDFDTTTTSFSNGIYHVYEIDTNLNLLWATHPSVQTINPGFTDFFPAASANSVYAVYQNRGTTTWDSASTTTLANTSDMVLLQFKNTDGTCTGAYKTSGAIPTNGNEFTDVKTDPQGNVYMFGNFTNSIGVPGDSVYSLGGANSPDYFILKWSPTVPTVVCSSAITRSNTDSLYTFNANATGTGALSYQWSNNGSAFSTNATPQLVLDNPGTYNICVTVTDANSCTTTHCDTITITAATCNTVINAQNTDSAYTFTTTNTGIGPYSYAWSNNGTAFSSSATANVVLSTAGTYNICVTVTGSNNCQSSQCYSVTVTAPSCAAHYTLYADTSVPHDWWALNQASGMGTLTYQWSWGDGSNSTGATPSHTYATAGNYNICLTITDSTGCTDTYCDSSTYIYKAESMVTVNAVTQLPTTTATGDILYQRLNGVVFPNPATTQAQLLFTVNHDQSAEFTVTDSKGSLVSRRTIQFRAGKNLYNFRTADWASGVYLITIQNQELKWSSRLVKE